MLTSITPFGERGRGQRWWLTATWLTVGHLVGGTLLGLLLAGLGEVRSQLFGDPSPSTVAWVLAGVTVLAAVHDASGRRLPGRRQVDERWLTTYRGWVYGLGFGTQLGFGLVTVVNTGLFVVLVVAGALIGGPTAVGLGVLYGAGRAVMALINIRVRSVEQLKALHRRLDDAATGVRLGGAALSATAAITLTVAM